MPLLGSGEATVFDAKIQYLQDLVKSPFKCDYVKDFYTNLFLKSLNGTRSSMMRKKPEVKISGDPLFKEGTDKLNYGKKKFYLQQLQLSKYTPTKAALILLAKWVELEISQRFSSSQYFHTQLILMVKTVR